MKTLLRTLAVAALTLSLVACSDSDDKKFIQAKATVDSVNALYNQIQGAGTPHYTWSDDELDAYSAKLDALAFQYFDLEAANGKNGVTVIFYVDIVEYVIARREEVAEARREKIRRAQVQANLDRYNANLKKYNDLSDKWIKMGAPDQTWTIESLREYTQTIDSMLGVIDVQLQILDKHGSDFYDSLSKSLRLRSSRSDLARYKTRTSLLIMQKEQESAAQPATGGTTSPVSSPTPSQGTSTPDVNAENSGSEGVEPAAG